MVTPFDKLRMREKKNRVVVFEDIVLLGLYADGEFLVVDGPGFGGAFGLWGEGKGFGSGFGGDVGGPGFEELFFVCGEVDFGGDLLFDIEVLVFSHGLDASDEFAGESFGF